MLHLFVAQITHAIYLWEIPYFVNNLLMKSERIFCGRPFESSTSYKQPYVPWMATEVFYFSIFSTA